MAITKTPKSIESEVENGGRESIEGIGGLAQPPQSLMALPRSIPTPSAAGGAGM
jgi:hypothetical protein